MKCKMSILSFAPASFLRLIVFLVLVLVSCTPRLAKINAGASQGETPLPQQPAPTGVASTACLDCHQYRENHHPIDIAPPDATNYPLPLTEGKITCLTCHVADHLEGGEKLLRGGPYADRRDICFQCHRAEAYAEIDPHLMLDAKGAVLSVNNKPVCLLCHAMTPDPARDRTGDVRFRADIAFLCWRCHPPMASPRFFREHFLVEPSPSMLRYIEKREAEWKVTIPLVPRDRITCSTCHNPHQKGVIIYGPSAMGADAQSKLRLPSPKLCLVCHDME